MGIRLSHMSLSQLHWAPYKNVHLVVYREANNPIKFRLENFKEAHNSELCSQRDLALPLVSFVATDNLLNLIEPEFSYLENQINICAYLLGLL